MAEKPSKNEEEYFARRDAELLRQQREAVRKTQTEAERRSHHMKCPKCGYDLITGEWHGIEVDQCTHCHGVWFDKGEVENLLQHESGIINRVRSEYFARRDAELLRQQREAVRKTQTEAERRSHHMKCPKCGYDLITGEWHGIEVDQCTHCHGVWFDKGEVENLLQHESGIINRVFRTVMRGVTGAKVPDA